MTEPVQKCDPAGAAVAVERMESQSQLGRDTHKIEKRVKRKIDFVILPLLSSVYFLAQMGRSDLGNAKVAGMDRDLKLTPKMYSNAASIFLVGYLIFQLPGTLLVRKIGPPLQFGLAMIAWGVVTTITVAIHNYSELMAIRAFVGVFEAFIQGAIFYLSFWYKYSELAMRGSILYSTSTLAGALNGLIAFAIEDSLDGKNGWEAWRWIFFIEGLIPIGWAFVIFTFLPPTPETVHLGFRAEEKEVLIQRSRAAHNTGKSKIIPKLIPKLFIQPQFIMVVLIDCGAHFCTSSMSNFLPDILFGLGYNKKEAQIMSVIVYACAFVALLVTGYLSDRFQQRGYAIAIVSCIGVLGYALLLGITNNTGRFVATCLVGMGTYPMIVLTLVWTATNNVGYTYRASAAACINVIAQCVAISGNQAYQDPPYYRKGLGISLAMITMSGVSALVLRVWLSKVNMKKVAERDGDEASRLRGCSVDDIGNKHPDFFFAY